MSEVKLSLSQLLTQENVQISTDVVENANVVIVPRKRADEFILDTYSIAPIKEIKTKVEKAILVQQEQRLKYAHFRGGEYELPLLILKEIVAPIVLGIISNWLYGRIKEYQKAKETYPKDPLVKEPIVKIKLYIQESCKYFEIEAPASEARKITKDFLKEKKHDI